MKTLQSTLAVLAVLVLAGCSQPTTTDAPPEPAEARVQLVSFREVTQGDPQAQPVSRGTSWDAVVAQEGIPDKADPADYGANTDGERWEDGIIRVKTYHLAPGAAIATHTHGIVIYAEDEIVLDGRINVRNQGAPPGTAGYADTRAATLALYRGYGETDADTGEPRLWGSGGQDGCPGGGYVILNAPRIVLNGDVDAGSDCGQAGIVYLEGNVEGTGTITASLVIHRGAV